MYGLKVIAAVICMSVCLSWCSAAKEERASLLANGDLIIGVLLPLHHQPKSKRATSQSGALVCGDIREMYGIQRVEVTLKTIDEINKDDSILPNITLGVEIRDSCWYAPVALQQSIELIRDSITPPAPPMSTCDAKNASNGAPSTESQKAGGRRTRGSLIGVIGPGSSSVALQVQNLLQLFHIPQVGYSTTSRDLSDKSRFNYFLRVVPSDYYQAQVILDIVRYYNWTYVSVVNTDENYGQSGIQAFRELAEQADVCIAKEDSVLSNADDEDFEDVVKNLLGDERARVVVCFCEGMTVRGLLAATSRMKIANKLTFIGSDGWADRSDVTEGYEREAHGSISIRIHSPYVREFDPYYLSLRPETNTRNPWFKEFWQSRFSCQLPGQNTNVNSSIKLCTGEERLNDTKYRQDSKLSFVIKAIYTFAHAMHNMQVDLCGRGGTGLCSRLLPFNGQLFKSYLMNVSFSYGDDVVEFDKRGDPPGRYDIVNFQRKEDGTYDYVQVGDWNNGSLTFVRQLQHGPGMDEVRSACSEPCAPGEYKNVQKGGKDKRCCWVCVPCGAAEILGAAAAADTGDADADGGQRVCRRCPPGSLPDATKTKCLPVPVVYVQWNDPEAIVSIFFSCLGFLTTFWSGVVFVRYNNTPVVKSSTRELSYLILAGATISHASTFPILAKPTKISCALTRLMPGISFAMIYASLVTKTNRIARILAGSKKRFPTRKPLFMSGMAQVVITSFLIAIEVIIATAMLALEPAAPTIRHPAQDASVLVCNTTPLAVLAPLAFDFLLILMCTVYALKTRNVPENFNEAKFIGFAMYTTCVIWIAFVPIYFGSDTKIITMCMCVTLSAMVTWAFLFAPKLYIILLRPERNNRALFTTSKSIRCHIGGGGGVQVHPSAATSGSWRSWSSDAPPRLANNNCPRQQAACQTGSDLLLCLVRDKECHHEGFCSPLEYGRTRAMSIPNGGGVRIREERISDDSLSDTGSCQIRSITISLGTTSTRLSNCCPHNHNPANCEYI